MKILIADDHWIVRETLRQVLKQLGRGDEVLEASTFTEVMAITKLQGDIGLILIDLVMPDFDTFNGLSLLRREVPHVPVVVISVHEDRSYVLQSINHGVVGYIPKTSSPAELFEALRLVLAGHVSFPRHILQQASLDSATAAISVSETMPQETPTGFNTSLVQRPYGHLTERENEVVTLLGQGVPVSGIAHALSLSPHTVRAHITNIMKRLGIANRTALMHYAVSQHVPKNGPVKSPHK